MIEKACINGKIVDIREARVSAFDAGFQQGFTLFETMRAYGRAVFLLERHLARMRGAAGRLGLAAPYTDGEIARCIQLTLEANRLEDAEVRLTLTPGLSPRYREHLADEGPQLIVTAAPVRPLPKGFLTNGVGAVLIEAELGRMEGLSAAQLKTGSRLIYALARLEAEKRGAYEAILCSREGFLLEGAATNVFFVAENELFTPPESDPLLPGTRRSLVAELAETLNLPLREVRIDRAAAARAEEIFLTNALIEMLPVSSLDGRPVGAGGPGRWTRALMEEYGRRREMERSLAVDHRKAAELGGGAIKSGSFREKEEGRQEDQERRFGKS